MQLGTLMQKKSQAFLRELKISKKIHRRGAENHRCGAGKREEFPALLVVSAVKKMNKLWKAARVVSFLNLSH
jgi:hypothetical protein